MKKEFRLEILYFDIFHESVNELIHDYRNMDDVDKFFEKDWMTLYKFATDEFLTLE